MNDRDEFAKAALPAVILCNCQTVEAMAHLLGAAAAAGRTVSEQIAVAAYEIADAMVRQQGPRQS